MLHCKYLPNIIYYIVSHYCHNVLVLFWNLYTGLFLSLRGTPIDNDGFVDVDDIGTNHNHDALLCLTSNTYCCGPSDPGPTVGDWYFPSGARVESVSNNLNSGRTDFYFRNRGQSVVRLNRNNHPSEKGRFRCNLIDIDGDSLDIYVNICEYTVLPVL